MEAELVAAGIEIRRAADPRGLPMHLKFAWIEAPGARWLAFGSFNWTQPSLVTNRELHAISRDGALLERFAERWHELWRTAGEAQPIEVPRGDRALAIRPRIQ
jgi:phosphatidylserine/phosphatidylglycerophosphate/cardiolipin synthase-like enzyme